MTQQISAQQAAQLTLKHLAPNVQRSEIQEFVVVEQFLKEIISGALAVNPAPSEDALSDAHQQRSSDDTLPDPT